MLSSVPQTVYAMNFKKTDSMEEGESITVGDHSRIPASKADKSIPVELTAYGTTPSGKPRLFVCNTCTRAFARLEHLRRHERSHTKEKPFGCGVCQRKFSRRDLLLRHAQKLHAGCADAITRLRRKSVKRSSSSPNGVTKGGQATDVQTDVDTKFFDKASEESNKPSPLRHTLFSNELPNSTGNSKNGFDLVQFNLNLFHQPDNNRATTRKSSIRDTNSASLQRQMFDRKKLSRSRGASFSAQSGHNYASGVSDFGDSYPGADNVEFSTPQILPTVHDDHAWLNLSTIPNMIDDDMANYMNGFSGNKSLKLSSITAQDAEAKAVNVATNRPMSGSNRKNNSFSAPDAMNLNYAAPATSYGSSEVSGMKLRKPSNGSIQNESNSSKPHAHAGGEYGYSFYDIPESVRSSTNGLVHIGDIPTPLEHDDTDVEMAIPLHDNSRQSNINVPGNTENFLHDFGALDHELRTNSKVFCDGYSFYGDYISASSSGFDSNSPMFSPNGHQSNNVLGPNAMADSFSKSQMRLLGFGDPSTQFPTDASMNPFLNQAQLMNIENNNNEEFQKNGKYTRNKLFTNTIRHNINSALNKYPVSDILTPTIPSNEKLEYYANLFIKAFLNHFPFIHVSKLNEYEIMSMTSSEAPANDSARSCLPLLVATIGALLANNKTDSENLYEASRRTIHIYLESRKLSNKDHLSTLSSMNPLWLIQSLTLSVIYGLFSDNENNVYIVVRQLNALNSLVKTSIRTNTDIFFSIHGDDEVIVKKYQELSSQRGMRTDTLFSNASLMNEEELRFKYNIILQSQLRIVFMIYRLTSFLLMLYNVPLTLSLNDLGSLRTPNKNNELLWSFKSYQAFQEYANTNFIDMSFYDSRIQLEFRDILYQVSSLRSQNFGTEDMDKTLASCLYDLGQFGFVCLIHGVFELNQYQGMKSIDVVFIMDTLSVYYERNSKNGDSIDGQGNESRCAQSNSQLMPHFETQLLDYAQLVNFVKLSSLIDFKYVKEHSWLKNYDELTHKYCILLMNNKVSDNDFIQIADYCIFTVKLILFRVKINIPQEPGNDNHYDTLMDEGSHLMESMDSFSSFFENLMHIKIFDEFSITKDSIHSQMLFHVFTLLSVFAIHVMKRNQQARGVIGKPMETGSDTSLLNLRFKYLLKVLSKIENVLKVRYQNMKLENEYTGLYLYSNAMGLDDNLKPVDFTLEKALYVLKIGELVMGFIYETNIKVSIFKKLAASLSQFRKFLIDNENMFLT